MSDDQCVSGECVHRKHSTYEARNSHFHQIIEMQHSFFDIDYVISTDNSSPTADDEDCSEDEYATMAHSDNNLELECNEDVYATINSDDNFESVNFEISQSIKLLTDLNYFVPFFNSNMPPLYGYRDKLNLSPLVTISSKVNTNMFEYLKVKEESMHAGGVEVNITKSDLLHMRVFKFNDFLWIVRCPKKMITHKIFHVGDKIISVNGEEVPDFNKFKQILAANNRKDVLKFRIQRLSRAKIFCIKAENYKSIFHLDEQNEFIVLNNLENDENNKWLITEIDGEYVGCNCNQITLKCLFEKQNNQYVSIVLHPKDFLYNYFLCGIQNI